MGLILTFITGLFFIVGILINKVCNNNKNIEDLSVAMAFVVVLNLLIFDIGPEVISDFSVMSLIFLIIGIGILKSLDVLIPHHEHHHKETHDNIKEHTAHLEHISIVTLLALVIHNIIECMALYNVTVNDVKSGVLMCIAIALHNLPLGFQMGSCLRNKKFLYTMTLTLSGFLGGIMSFLIKDIPEVFTSYLLSFTLGMLIYLWVFELLKELWESRKNIYSLYGVIIGLILIVITMII